MRIALYRLRMEGIPRLRRMYRDKRESVDPEHGDKPAGKRIEQCKEWAKLYPGK
jgi:hypothetical protein